MTRRAIEKTLLHEVGRVPQRLLEMRIANKLRGANVDHAPSLPEKIADHFMSGEAEWRDDNISQSFDLEITDDDLAEIRSAAREFNKDLPNLINQMVREAAADSNVAIKEKWASHKADVQFETNDQS